MLESRTSIKWYNIIESTESTKNILGPQTKFSANRSCVTKSNERKIGAITVEGRGIKKISLVNILNRSASIWKAPFLPMRVGPIRLCAKASNLRSVKTMNSVKSTTNNEESNAASCNKV